MERGWDDSCHRGLPPHPQDCVPTTHTVVVDGEPTLECTLGYTCECAPGFYGDNCSVLIDHCDPNLCQNGGICHDLLLGYRCECLPGYTGENCETELDECEEYQPCLNGATCTVREGRGGEGGS